MTITWPDPATDIKTSKHFTSKHKTSPAWNGRRLVHSKEMIWASRWSVALRTFYRQVLSVLYSSFPFGNFRPRLVRALLVKNYMWANYSWQFTLRGKSLTFHFSPPFKVTLSVWVARICPRRVHWCCIFQLSPLMLRSGRSTWHLKITCLKRKIIFLNFQGCIQKDKRKSITANRHVLPVCYPKERLVIDDVSW